jgi:hypothetical protein
MSFVHSKFVDLRATATSHKLELIASIEAKYEEYNAKVRALEDEVLATEATAVKPIVTPTIATTPVVHTIPTEFYEPKVWPEYYSYYRDFTVGPHGDAIYGRPPKTPLEYEDELRKHIARLRHAFERYPRGITPP